MSALTLEERLRELWASGKLTFVEVRELSALHHAEKKDRQTRNWKRLQRRKRARREGRK